MSSSQTSSSSSDSGIAREFAGMLDVVCSVDVVVGWGSITVRECLRLRAQSVIPLKQAAGADLELRVQGVTLATGEIVIVDDGTAVRVAQVSAPQGAEAAA